jgi:hypothetical protein
VVHVVKLEAQESLCGSGRQTQRILVWYRVVNKMASFIQSRLQKIKPSAKNVIEKYKETFEQAQKELKTPEQLRQGLETFLTASKINFLVHTS